MGTADAELVHAELTTHINELQDDIRHIRSNLVKTIATSLLTVFLVLGTSIWYANHVRSVSDQRWCTLMISLDNRQQKLKNGPVITADQLEFINNIHNLRSDLGCD